MNPDLSKLICPKSVALIGATERAGSVGAGLVDNLWEGRDHRRIFWVNPHASRIKDEPVYDSVSKIKESIDLAVVAVPPPAILPVIEECSRKKVGSIIIITAGFAEIGAVGKELQDKVAALVKRAGIPLLGPNCLGFIRPSVGLNASFAPLMPPTGGIAFISQSGALMNSVIDRSGLENYGFSWLASYGNGADLSPVDLIRLADQDQSTKVVALYLEGLERGREFMEAAKDISTRKPIIALKAGRTEEGSRAAASHTASLAGSDKIYRAAFRQCGVRSAASLEELFDWAKALAWQPRVKGGVGIVTNGGGMGVLATDAAADRGLVLPNLDRETAAVIGRSDLMPKTVSLRNPLDIIGDADTDRYALAIEAMLAQRDIGLLVVIQTKQTMTDIRANMEALVAGSLKHPDKAVVSVCLPGHFSQEAIKWLEEKKIPNYSDPERALKAARVLIS